jgi:hypothetical protein
MKDDKSVLVVGLDPYLIDFTKPGYPPGMSAEKVMTGIKFCEEELAGLGYNVKTCYTDFGETAESVLQKELSEKAFHCVMIGAGVRTNPDNFILFEKLVNVAHEHAPQAKICFNTLPNDVSAAVQRWL